MYTLRVVQAIMPGWYAPAHVCLATQLGLHTGNSSRPICLGARSGLDPVVALCLCYHNMLHEMWGLMSCQQHQVFVNDCCCGFHSHIPLSQLRAPCWALWWTAP